MKQNKNRIENNKNQNHTLKDLWFLFSFLVHILYHLFWWPSVLTVNVSQTYTDHSYLPIDSNARQKTIKLTKTVKLATQTQKQGKMKQVQKQKKETNAWINMDQNTKIRDRTHSTT